MRERKRDEDQRQRQRQELPNEREIGEQFARERERESFNMSSTTNQVLY